MSEESQFFIVYNSTVYCTGHCGRSQFQGSEEDIHLFGHMFATESESANPYHCVKLDKKAGYQPISEQGILSSGKMGIDSRRKYSIRQ